MTPDNVQKTPKVFISYSWSDGDKVIELAERLIGDGVDVSIDKYDLKPGQDKYKYMERMVADPSIDKVLLFCTQDYAEKADNRKGGVGDEAQIITPEIYTEVDQTKYIPLICEKDEDGKPCHPQYLKTRIYIDLSDDDRYESEYDKLLRNLHNEPEIKKPKLGAKPEWLKDEGISSSPLRSVINKLKKDDGKNDRKTKSIAREFCANYIEILREYSINYSQDPSAIANEVVAKIEEMKAVRDLYIDYLEELIKKETTTSKILTEFFENIYNDLIFGVESPEGYAYHGQNNPQYRFLLWEMFICTTAFLWQGKSYRELHDILHHTYDLRTNHRDEYKIAGDYRKFCHYCRAIEDVYKQSNDLDNRASVRADMIIRREYKRIINKNSVVNADLVLFHMYDVLFGYENGSEFWFPWTYIYDDNSHNRWHLLKSKKHCESLFPLFGVESIEELKKKIQKNRLNGRTGYPLARESLSIIQDSIKLEEIGSLP